MKEIQTFYAELAALLVTVDEALPRCLLHALIVALANRSGVATGPDKCRS